MKWNRQINIGNWWGKLLLSATQLSMFMALFTMSFAGIAAYETIHKWFAGIGVDIAFWHFVVMVIILLGIGLFLAHMLGLASFFSSWNEQFWSHKNPMRLKLEEQEKQINEMTKLLKTLGDKIESDKKSAV